jgi:DNA-binding NtrC family response regulator
MSDRPRVLFVDDEQRVLNSMRAMFRREFELFLTTDGATAVKIAAANEIDVIVADQRMPGMSGIEVLDMVKRLSPKTMRILLTGYADPAAIEGSINVGEVFRFLGKPCPPKQLRETIRLAVQATRSSSVSELPQLGKERRSSPRLRNGSGFGDEAAFIELPILQTQPANGEADQKQRAKDVGVVVYTMDSVFAETALRTLSNERNTMLATSLVKTMQALETHSSGVLITDITTDFARLNRIVGALKQQVPELVTIVASDTRDSGNMISLINYGQVFRYELKPVTPGKLRVDINEAAIKHMTLRNNPDLEKRHRVEDLPLEAHSGVYARDFGAIAELSGRRARVINV